jgi:ribosomal protein S7
MTERNVAWIIANAINEQARGNPEALAADIIAALQKTGYCTTPEDTAR